MTVLRDILDWSTSRPDWQRDALRRLVSASVLTDQDIGELAQMVQRSRGLKGDGADPSPSPLSEAHIALPAAGGEGVVLTALRDFTNVNALATKQTLNFEAAGLTVVYGDNGAGKSGYVRVLKQLCRARSPGDGILGNLISGDSSVPHGFVEYTRAGQKTTVQWSDGSVPPDDLSAVSVFDTDCASVYVDDESPVAYRPFGLDLLAGLASACDRVKSLLQARIAALHSQRLSAVGYSLDGTVHRLLQSLSPRTTRVEIDAVGVLSAAERERMQMLQLQIAEIDLDGPQKRAAELRNKASRIKSIRTELAEIHERPSTPFATSLKAARDAHATAEEAARLASALRFQDQPLPHVGSSAWRSLWEAARVFSTSEAYKDTRFPYTAAGALCVLCQQPLEPEAAERLENFERFVQDRSQQAVAAAVRNLSALRTQLQSAATSLRSAVLLDDLGPSGTVQREAVVSLLATATARKESLEEALGSGDWQSVTECGTLPIPQLEALLLDIEKAATEAESSSNPSQKAQLQAELVQLQERDRLGREIDAVLAEIERLSVIHALEKCIADTDTSAITRKSTQLTKAYVSDALCKTFEDELQALGLRHLSVVMDPTGGSKGTLYHKVEIRRPDGSAVAGVSRVLSEGEQRCIALAAFLAELTTQDGGSTIILDDPVSSLDHERREAIARRLVSESERRPVVVFTHDLVFLLSLDRLAKKSSVAFAGRHLRRSTQSVGAVIGDLPWYGLPVSRRLGVLKERHQRVARHHKDGLVDEYMEGAWVIYGLLRESWERAVEEVLLNEAILRYGREIQTKRLEKALDITAADYAVLEAGMDRCSTFNAGHDAAPAANLQMPEPDEVLKDIVALETWITSIRKRRSK
ncbi:MAG: AAA family ATPase [Gemmatimonadetes bacterium]|nr:AAA family ATPase [Gemmatimonadota bacterium]